MEQLFKEISNAINFDNLSQIEQISVLFKGQKL